MIFELAIEEDFLCPAVAVDFPFEIPEVPMALPDVFTE